MKIFIDNGYGQFTAGINSATTITYYKGSDRIEGTKEKWGFISMHTGRRTFICSALEKASALKFI